MFYLRLLSCVWLLSVTLPTCRAHGSQRGDGSALKLIQALTERQDGRQQVRASSTDDSDGKIESVRALVKKLMEKWGDIRGVDALEDDEDEDEDELGARESMMRTSCSDTVVKKIKGSKRGGPDNEAGCGVPEPGLGPHIKKQGSERIVGGEEADYGDWPWLVGFDTGPGECGATYMGGEWVLTAAHCLFNNRGNVDYEPCGASCIFGEHSVISDTEDVERLTPTKVLYHKKYSTITFKNDIALLKMPSAPSDSDYVSPICLPDSNYNIYDPDLTCYIAGWGLTDYNDYNSLSPVVLHVEVNMVKRSECKNRLGQYADELKRKMICAGEPGVDTCQGDSGGPLVCKKPGDKYFTLVGITSWGYDCGGDTPGVYTDVRKYIKWINYVRDKE